MPALIILSPAARTIGTLNHGDAISFNTPLNVTTSAATQVFDQGQDGAGVMNAFWGGGWPNAASNSVANMKNRVGPFQALGSSTMNPPTPNTAAFLAACHYDINTSVGGNNAMLWTNYPAPTFPYFSYWSWYERDDPFWWYTSYPASIIFTATFTAGSSTFTVATPLPTGMTSGDGNQLFSLADAVFTSTQASPCTLQSADPATGICTMNKPALVSGVRGNNSISYSDRDENNKRFNLNASGDPTPYGSTNSWYTVLGPGTPKSNSAATSWANGEDNGVPAVPDQNGHSNSWGVSFNPANPSLGWVKKEYVYCWTSATTGFSRYFENGLLRANYLGPTSYAGSQYVEAIGGYGRNQGLAGGAGSKSLVSPIVTAGTPNTYTQWRYWGNIFYFRQQSTLARLYATNASSFSLAGGVFSEPQPGTFASGVYSGHYNKANLAAGPVTFWAVDEANPLTSTPVQVGSAVSN